jgi:FkbM family methyltransferase
VDRFGGFSRGVLRLKAIVPSFIRRLARRNLYLAQLWLRDLASFFRESTFRPYVTTKTVDEHSFKFYIADLQGQEWYDSGMHYYDQPDTKDVEPKLWKELRLVGKGDVVFECGGHHGWTAILLSRLVGEHGKVITFEPHPRNVYAIQQNMRLNGIDNVTVEKAAVGPSNGTITLFNKSDTVVRPGFYDERYWPETRRKSILDGFTAPMVSLDAYAEAHGIYPSALKIDVEGYEIEVLKGARRILNRLPKLLLEIHHPDALERYGTSASDLFQVIDMDCYEFWEPGAPAETFDVSGLKTHIRRLNIYGMPKTMAAYCAGNLYQRR